MRKSGILLPIFSLPSRFGIGSFSREAYEFVDFLVESGQSLWQILPLGPTGYGDSPYQSFSTFAGNPYFIDLEELIQRGWLFEDECVQAEVNLGFEGESHPEYVDYERIYRTRNGLLHKAYLRSEQQDSIFQSTEYREWYEENAFWLVNYALYATIKEYYGGEGWSAWEDAYRLRNQEVLEQWNIEHPQEMRFIYFQQYFFAMQWKKLKAYANQNGVLIVGDIPIYVAFDSADTWAMPELFQMDEAGTPLGVAGCPPDAFAPQGQLWGNPLYRWEYHESTGYDWWMRRLEFQYRLYDVVRIDHFRGFEAYYSIPYMDTTAEFGHWEKGPGLAFFDTMKARLGDRAVIAEDLGFLTQEVKDMVEATGYPGMKILQFAFDPSGQSLYLPYHYNRNCVVYSGTHDNDTVLGWYQITGQEEIEFANHYLDAQEGKENWAYIRAALGSVADTAIIPMQDYLDLGTQARINIPSTLGNNWKWRMNRGVCSKELADKVRKLSWAYGRCSSKGPLA